jgi:hypothetical protein
MAKQTVITLTDDIDGTEASESVEFGIDGYLYTVDLSADHAEELRDRLTAYREFGSTLGRYTTRSAGLSVPRRSPRPADRDRNTAIRAWAAANGLNVKARGKIAGSVIKKYEATLR